MHRVVRPQRPQDPRPPEDPGLQIRHQIYVQSRRSWAVILAEIGIKREKQSSFIDRGFWRKIGLFGKRKSMEFSPFLLLSAGPGLEQPVADSRADPLGRWQRAQNHRETRVI